MLLRVKVVTSDFKKFYVTISCHVGHDENFVSLIFYQKPLYLHIITISIYLLMIRIYNTLSNV